MVLKAGCAAPVGRSLYEKMHITVVQDQNKLLYLCEAAWKRFSSKDKVKEIAGDTVTEERANVTTVTNQMHLAATNLGLGSVYMWGHWNL